MNALIILFSNRENPHIPTTHINQSMTEHVHQRCIEGDEKIYLLSEKDSYPFQLDGIIYKLLHMFNFINNHYGISRVPINIIASTLIYFSYNHFLGRTSIHPCVDRPKFSYKYEYQISVKTYDWIVKINGGQETSMKTLEKNINEISDFERLFSPKIINKFIYNNGPCKTCLVSSVCCKFSKRIDNINAIAVQDMCDEVKSLKRNHLEQKLKEIPSHLQQYLRNDI